MTGAENRLLATVTAKGTLGEQSRIRTCDTRGVDPLLYQTELPAHKISGASSHSTACSP